jgi:hypothetical protein
MGTQTIMEWFRYNLQQQHQKKKKKKKKKQ